MAQVPVLGLKTHAQRVCTLYKRALRNLEAFYDRRDVYRYQAVMLRARFDKNRCEPDMRVAVDMLQAGEQELFRQLHPIPRKFSKSPGGVAWGRVVEAPDWVLDYWHPLEKAQYPEYFARREKRKQEYVEWWQKQYGSAPGSGDSAH